MTAPGPAPRAAAIGSPQLVQNRAPGAAAAPHDGQARAERAAPHDAQKFPEAERPQLGQVFSWLMVDRVG